MTQLTPKKASRGQVIAWGLWDWGSAGFNTIIVTFVFSVYLTSSVGKGLCTPEQLTADGSCPDASSMLGWALGIAGFFIAVLAPVTGQRADAGGRRRLSLGVFTYATVATMLALYFVQNESSYLWFALVMIGIGSITMEFAGVSYNAMLRQISTPANIGRVSGFGWSMGYFGGIFLLLLCYVGFIASDDDSTTAGLLGISKEGGLNIRLVAVLAAVWLALSAIPVLRKVPEVPASEAGVRLGLVGSYRALFRHIATLYRTERHTVFFLLASALFRDGLAGVFTFGAVLAVNTYGFTSGGVLIFGVAANIISALGAVVLGLFDDRIGPKTVIVISLVGMLAAGTVLLFVSGPTMFWIFGLLLCVWVGPAQSSSRTYLARLAPPGREGELFGLYATTGRAVSFLAPALFALFVSIFDVERYGIIGILLVLLAGLLALLPVRRPVDALTRPVPAP
jgi:UMF1 family MFS transporter